MARRQLLFLIPNLNGGGAERVMIHLLGHVDRTQFDITLGLGRASGHFLAQVPDNVGTIIFGHERSYFAIPRLARYLRSRKYDLVYTMTAMNLAAIAARELVRANVLLVLGARNHYSRCLPIESTYPAFRMKIVRALYPRADLIIGVSQNVYDDLVQNFGVSRSRVIAIPNPLDLVQLRAQAASRVDHPWFTGAREIPVILNVGKLMDAKGHFDLIEAFRILRTRQSARLLMLGQGPLEVAIRKRIGDLGLENDVQLLGFQPNPFAFMSRADIFVLASHWEGFPNVLSEAMACGAPVVSTDCPSGPSEIIRDGETGVLVPVASPLELARAIENLLTDRGRRAAFAERGRRECERYEVRRIVGQYVEAFEHLIRDRHRRVA
jgi:glycosyltransferase involved in cell wall biosynthesis